MGRGGVMGVWGVVSQHVSGQLELHRKTLSVKKAMLGLGVH